MARYEWPAGCDSITGMSEEYEQATRAMIVAGLEWMDAAPPSVQGRVHFRNPNGMPTPVVLPDTDESFALTRAMEAAVPHSSGAMFQTALQVISQVISYGWEPFVSVLARRALEPEETTFRDNTRPLTG